MTLSPPVPPGNQSPFPLHEPPHHGVTASGAVEAQDGTSRVVSRKMLATVGGAVGLGAALLVALRLTTSRKTVATRSEA